MTLLRLLRRYQPYVIVLVAVVLVTVFPATHHHDDSSDVTSSGSPEVTSPASGGGASVPGAGTDGVNAPGQSATGSVGGTGRQAVAASGGTTTATVTGSGMGTEAALSAPDCDRSTGRIKIAYFYRPPCVVPWPAGADNGGATSTGVTADKIKVVYYHVTRDPRADLETAKKQMATGIPPLERFYRMWGRKIDLVYFESSGSGEVPERADAIAIANMKPFAVMGDSTPLMLAEFGARKIIAIALGGVTVDLSLKFAPYIWGGSLPPDIVVEQNAAEYIGKRLLNKPARWAGDPTYQAQPRKFALIYPEEWNPKVFEDRFTKLGGKLVDKINYGSDPTSWAERARTIAARLHDEGVTSVIAGTDALYTAVMTKAATSQDWFPEWVMTGYAGQDLGLFATSYDAAQWKNAFGPAAIQMAARAGNPEQLFYKWYWGNKQPDPTASTTGTNYPALFSNLTRVLFKGIHGAGPHLTPETFRDGIFAVPPVGGTATPGSLNQQISYGRWGFTTFDDYNAADDFSEVYWDPTATPAYADPNNPQAAGAYRYLNGGRRYLPSNWPAGEPAMFNPSGTVQYYDKFTPADEQPNYPCTGCPSQS